jgi:hypothetical protein
MIIEVIMTDGTTELTDVGNQCHFVTRKKGTERFNECMEAHFGPNENPECYGFILYNNCQSYLPLFNGFRNKIIYNQTAKDRISV